LFKVGGALTIDHSNVYIERRTDYEALLYLRSMDYVLVIEPRQQGKTSLVNHLISRVAGENMAFVYVDVTTHDRTSEATWYETLCPRILRQLKFISPDEWPAIPLNSYQWREFLYNIAILAANANHRVIIALDEIGAIFFPGATEFFSVLRDVFNSRQVEREFRCLTFMLVGAFHPRDLITDDRVSPFNIAQRVRLPDFDQTQVDKLVQMLGLSQSLQTNEELTGPAREVSNRLFYWTNGQPYLTQWLCHYLASCSFKVSATDVDHGVDQWRREDANHLSPLIDRLHGDEDLSEYLVQISEGKHFKYYPFENRRQAQLELLGAIKVDAEGYCRVRNRIYDLVFRSVYDQSTSDKARPSRATEMNSNESEDVFASSGEKTTIVNIWRATDVRIGDEADVKQILTTPESLSAEKLWRKIEVRLSEIEGVMQTGFDDLRRGQVAIYRQIGEAYREPLAQILEWIQLGRMEQGEMERTLDAIRRVLLTMQTLDVKLGAAMREAIEGAQTAVNSKLDLRQKLELTLPIIPIFLDYKVELTAGSEVDLNAAREELKRRWQALLGRSASRT
jgi:hypothetical protein